MALEVVVLDSRSNDRLVWKFTANGVYSVKSFCMESEQRRTSHISSVANYVWKKIAPPKVEIFCWLASMGRISTRDLLKKRSIIGADGDDKCPMCESCVESADHLLIHCKWSWLVWNACLEWWGTSVCLPKTVSELISGWSISEGFGLRKIIWDMMLFAGLWTIWLARNEAIFKGKRMHWKEAVDLVKIRLAIWVKAKRQDLEYSINDFLRSIDGVRSITSVKKLRPVICWAPPSQGELKFNTDGSARGKPGAAGMGGVLRDENGKCLCLFSAPLGVMDSNLAETLAIKKALQLFSVSCWVGSKKLIVESDSKVAIAWIRGCEDRPWRYGFLFNEISSIISMIGGVSFIHTFREANGMADSLAKQGVERGVEFIAWL